jgi:hypothetical protein
MHARRCVGVVSRSPACVMHATLLSLAMLGFVPLLGRPGTVTSHATTYPLPRAYVTMEEDKLA